MVSKAAKQFGIACDRAERLLAVSTDRRLRPVSYVQSEPMLHAALAASVSAWEAYIESVVIESMGVIAIGASAGEMVLLGLLRAEAENAVSKFNTPNAENCRDLILRYVGIDIFPIMISKKTNLVAHFARAKLNEILKVRHAFAHGFSIPSYSWTIRYGIQNRLTKRAVSDCHSLVCEFVNNIDLAISAHIGTVFPGRPIW